MSLAPPLLLAPPSTLSSNMNRFQKSTSKLSHFKSSLSSSMPKPNKKFCDLSSSEKTNADWSSLDFDSFATLSILIHQVYILGKMFFNDHIIISQSFKLVKLWGYKALCAPKCLGLNHIVLVHTRRCGGFGQYMGFGLIGWFKNGFLIICFLTIIQLFFKDRVPINFLFHCLFVLAAS